MPSYRVIVERREAYEIIIDAPTELAAETEALELIADSGPEAAGFEFWANYGDSVRRVEKWDEEGTE